MTNDPIPIDDPRHPLFHDHLPSLHPAAAELQPAGDREWTGDFKEATNVLLADISWNLATLAREAKRIADALEQRDA